MAKALFRRFPLDEFNSDAPCLAASSTLLQDFDLVFADGEVESPATYSGEGFGCFGGDGHVDLESPDNELFLEKHCKKLLHSTLC